MKKDKRSFFERLTGAVQIDDDMEYESEVQEAHVPENNSFEEEVGELSVDVYQTPTNIIIKTMVAGVRPDDLDISITRDAVRIEGKREMDRTVQDDSYYHRELYWGSFSRTIHLPEEIDVEESEAIERHGLLMITLPKINKDKKTRLKVKTG